MNVGLISPRAIGGMKNLGSAPNGTCNSMTVPYVAVIEPAKLGKSLGSMIEGNRNLRFVNREPRAAVTIHDVTI